MSTQVVRIEGYNKGSLGTIGRECDRCKGVNHRNEDIDQNLSFLNYSYKDASHGFTSEYADIITSLNVKAKETKKSIAFEGVIITADLPFFEGLGYKKGKPMPKEVKAFFDSSYEFTKAWIGYQGTDKNILSAKIHLDEKTPHLHLYYVPVTEKWQTKVYAKNNDGKVMRTERGTPIQAKDANGKTLYEQHEDKTAPKLSRTEFWRVRGAQSSYRIMQDRFQEQVGKQYGLERGEVGSDRKHKKAAIFKQEQLAAETQKLTSEIEPYKELRTCTAEVEAKGKMVLPGIVAVKKKDLESLKEQAKAYSVNRDEIDNIRQKQTLLTEREYYINQRDNKLNIRMSAVIKKEKEVNSLYNRQLQLNELLEAAEKKSEENLMRFELVRERYKFLSTQANDSKEYFTKQIDCFKMQMKELYEILVNVIAAIAMLNKSNDYKIRLTSKQNKLIDSIISYASDYFANNNQIEIAEVVKKSFGIVKEIDIKINPPEYKKAYFYDYEEDDLER